MRNTFYRNSIGTMIALCTLTGLFVRATAQPITQAATAQSDSSAPQLVQPEELARSVQSAKGDNPSFCRLGFMFSICRRTFRTRNTSALLLDQKGFSSFASGLRLCRTPNPSCFTVAAVPGANVQTSFPHTRNSAI
jgi:hypothetical protein